VEGLLKETRYESNSTEFGAFISNVVELPVVTLVLTDGYCQNYALEKCVACLLELNCRCHLTIRADLGERDHEFPCGRCDLLHVVEI
jgi:hypothetical protein